VILCDFELFNVCQYPPPTDKINIKVLTKFDGPKADIVQFRIIDNNSYSQK
jgi:hypothetical protein